MRGNDMPTLELHGFDERAGDQLVSQMRQVLQDLAYCEDIVFDRTYPGQVIGWDGSWRPFVRVCSRRQEKIDEIRTLLNPLCDVETLMIGFFPQSQESVANSEQA